MNTIRVLLTSATLGAAALAANVQAQVPATAPAPAATTAPAAVLSIRQIHDSLEAAGYRNITEIELERNRYEVKARDPQGRWVKLYVNAHTGAIETVKSRD